MKLMVWLRIEDYCFSSRWLGTSSGKVVRLLAVLGSRMDVATEAQILVFIS
jgi:hypothetical protein